MTREYILQVTTDAQVSLSAEYDYKDGGRKVENSMRVRDGSLFAYRWAFFKEFDFSVMYVNSSTKAIVNSWWETGTLLSYYEVQSGTRITDVTTVRLMNTARPIDQCILPYADQFKGKLNLEEV